MDPKKGMATSEWMTLIAGMIVAIVPILTRAVPPGSVMYVILGVLGAAATYIAGRSWLKGQVVKAEALRSAVKPADPTPPSA